MPCRDGFSSRNARKLKAKRTEERLANEDKLIDKSNERSIQYIDRICDVKFTAKLARRNEKSKQKSKSKRKSKRKSQNKSAPFVLPQPGVGPAPLASDTEIESTAMTVTVVVDDEARSEHHRMRYLNAFNYAGKLARGEIYVMDQKGQVRRVSHANAAKFANNRFGLQTADGTRERLISETTARTAKTASNPPPPMGPVPKKRPIIALQIQASATATTFDVDVEANDIMTKRARLVAAVEDLQADIDPALKKDARKLAAELEARLHQQNELQDEQHTDEFKR